ncbi:MAG: hypothetical protein AAF633_01610, partial [Chloroflexota bacterium]
GVCYNLINLYEAAIYADMPDEAFEFEQLVFNQIQKLDSPVFKALTITDIAYMKLVTEDYESAKENYLVALDLLRNKDQLNSELEVMTGLAHADLYLGNRHEARTWIDPIYQKIVEDEGWILEASLSLHSLWILYKLLIDSDQQLALSLITTAYNKLKLIINQIESIADKRSLLETNPIYLYILEGNEEVEMLTAS